MFRFFHNTVLVCTRSLACSALLHMPCTSSRCALEQEAKEIALGGIPSSNGFRRCTVPGKHLNIYPVDRAQARCAIRARVLGARPQEAEMVLRVFQFLPSSIHTSYIYVYTYIIRSQLSRRVGFRSYTSYILAHTVHACFARKELQ